MEKVKYLTKCKHEGVRVYKNSLARCKVRVWNVLFILLVTLSFPFVLCGCGAKATEDEVVMKLLNEEAANTNTQNYTENETIQQTAIDIKTISALSAIDDANITESTSQSLYIYICGAVENPGVYELEIGSRLYEAVEKAGGLKESADETCLNLARQVVDGEQVVILTREQTKELQKVGGYIQGQLNSSSSTLNMPSTTGVSTKESELVNINTATISELITVSGIGESRAQAIIAYRETNGNFYSIEDIKKVEGIKEGLFAKIKNKITV